MFVLITKKCHKKVGVVYKAPVSMVKLDFLERTARGFDYFRIYAIKLDVIQLCS